MIERLDDSVRANTDRKAGEKTKQKNAQLRFAQKTLRLTKTMRVITIRCWVASFKMIRK